ncbi:MAG: hypothetical protein NT027_10110 [Proteobacteria bacterium]|nr:hypothetical protein [Pseudomonadota bacterium]
MTHLDKTNVFRYVVMCILLVSSSTCRLRDSKSSLREGETVPTVDAELSPVDNRSATGGLLGSSDEMPADLVALPKFKMSGAYPATADYLTTQPPFPNMDILKGSDPTTAKAEAKRWLDAMQTYIYEDMNDQSKDPNNLFRHAGGGEISKKRWYHMPWLQSVGAKATNNGRGRDSIWGLTREGIDLNGPFSWPVRIGSTCLGQEWGLALFNEPGAFAIGQAFPAGTNIDPPKAVFPVGTVSSKLLFAAADPAAVPEIATAMQIQAWINGGGKCSTNEPRQLTTMYHIQNDIMLKFGPNPGDWIFGVFVHNPKKILSEANPQGYWQGMEPLGVQWGTQLAETIVVSDELKPNGNGGRLNGPADGSSSNCYGCHQGGRDFSFEFDIGFQRQNSEKARLGVK